MSAAQLPMTLPKGYVVEPVAAPPIPVDPLVTVDLPALEAAGHRMADALRWDLVIALAMLHDSAVYDGRGGGHDVPAHRRRVGDHMSYRVGGYLMRHYEKVYALEGWYLGLIYQDDDGQWMAENRLGDAMQFVDDIRARGWLLTQVDRRLVDAA